MPAALIAFTVALIASLSLTVPVRQLALRVGLVDHPGPRKVHVKPIPLLGGLAMYCGVVLAILISMPGPLWVAARILPASDNCFRNIPIHRQSTHNQVRVNRASHK